MDRNRRTGDRSKDPLRKQMSNTADILSRLAAVLEERKTADPDSSYVASLYARGRDKILEKVGEEAVETILAAKNDDPDQLIYETADLWFHTMVMLAEQNIHPDRVMEELARRFGLSGLAEKASRRRG